MRKIVSAIGSRFKRRRAVDITPHLQGTQINLGKLRSIKEHHIGELVAEHNRENGLGECGIVSTLWDNECPNQIEDRIKVNSHLSL